MFSIDADFARSQDVIELRERRWAPRRARARPGPMTIAQILAAVCSKLDRGTPPHQRTTCLGYQRE